MQKNSDGIGLLACGAARHPNADRRSCLLACEHLRYGQLFERLESLRVTEEICNTDQKISIQLFHLARRLM
jgi:hypothetical protein